MTFGEIADRYGVSKATVTKWCSDARYIDKIDLDGMKLKIESLEKENQKLKDENERLQKMIALAFGQGLAAQG